MAGYNNEVILVSGGIESTIMAFFRPLARKVYVDLGQKTAERDTEYLNKIFGGNFEVIQSRITKRDSFIPNKDLTIISLVSTAYNPAKIFLGGTKPVEYFRDLSQVVSKGSLKTVSIENIFRGKSKGEIVKMALDGGIPRASFQDIAGCTCGECNDCFEKWVAYTTNGIECKTPSERMLRKQISLIDVTNGERRSRVLQALSKVKRILSIEIDGTLCIRSDDKDYDRKIPIISAIEKIQQYHRDGVIILLHSQRLECERYITEQWLMDNDVYYDSLILEKVPYTRAVDDLMYREL